MALRIRKAQPTDAAQLTKLAHDAVRNAGYPEHWIDQSDLEISAELLERRDAYIAGEVDDVRGFYVLMGDGSGVDHLWVGPAYAGTGVGKELFLHAQEMITQIKKTKDLIRCHQFF